MRVKSSHLDVEQDVPPVLEFASRKQAHPREVAVSSGSRGAWGAQIEEALRNLRDIDGASVVTEGDEIREIHIVTSSDRPGKQLVRDIETAIQTRFNRAI